VEGGQVEADLEPANRNLDRLHQRFKPDRATIPDIAVRLVLWVLKDPANAEPLSLEFSRAQS
jgi:hypothetical protein